MSIVAEDWDDLAEARRRRDERTGVAAPSAVAEPAPGLADAAGERSESDAYGETAQHLKVPASIAGANILIWLAGRLLGVVELVGVAFFASVALLLAAYVMREWQRDRIALICLAGALPLPVTIVGLFS